MFFCLLLQQKIRWYAISMLSLWFLWADIWAYLLININIIFFEGDYPKKPIFLSVASWTNISFAECRKTCLKCNCHTIGYSHRKWIKTSTNNKSNTQISFKYYIPCWSVISISMWTKIMERLFHFSIVKYKCWKFRSLYK